MKTSNLCTAIASTAIAAALGLSGAPAALADVTTTTLGSQAELVNGDVVQGWTVKDLKPSSDVIPHAVHGVLWEATATDTAIAGSVIPIVSNFNARARNGETYRVLFGAATPQGVNPAAIAQGQQTSGKLYFDVTGAEPDSVVYNAGGTDLAVWVTPPPAPPRSSGSSTSRTPSTGSGSAAAAEVPAEQEPGQATPASVGTEDLPEGSSGTPLPGSSGTPLPAGSSGTPVGAPAPEAAAAEALAPEAGSLGTPATPPAQAPSAAPAGSSGTPVEGQSHGPAPASVAPTAPPAQGQPAAAVPAEATPASAAPATTVVVPPPGA